MHELGIVIEIVKQIEQYTIEQKIQEVDKLVLQIGELSGVVPRYIEEVYPIAIEKSPLKNMKLEIEVTPGIGQCKECGLSYNLIQNDHTCPLCSSKEWTIITGTDFVIKEIHAK